YWVALHGKYNRVDHCHFINKLNLGVLVAVILDQEASRNNFHSIDHNKFDFRSPLASNTGEMIRVGLAENCEFNSNTIIENNVFENCDGEAEIISIKSGANLIKNNLFTSCQGSVVLRHGNNNKVIGNIFNGNNKPGTGGVRIINEGNWILNNYFFKCRGEGFRAPLCIMNGVPNSPALRYLPVTHALISNNTFIECAPMSFGEGSDAERSQPPANVAFLNNLFINTRDSLLFFAHDKTNGFQFAGNQINKEFYKQGFPEKRMRTNNFPKNSQWEGSKINVHNIAFWKDSIRQYAPNISDLMISDKIGVVDSGENSPIKNLTSKAAGTTWFTPAKKVASYASFSCSTGDELIKVIQKNKASHVTILLTGNNYQLSSPLIINCHLTLTAMNKNDVQFNLTVKEHAFVFQILAGGSLMLNQLSINLKNSNAAAFIASDSSGNSAHASLIVKNCKIINNERCFFFAYKSSVLDSIFIANNQFSKGGGILFNCQQELDRKGYYNVEKFIMINNTIDSLNGEIVSVVRSGVDESTLGPIVTIIQNKVSHVQSNLPLISLWGAQKTRVQNNQFTFCNPNHILIKYHDEVTTEHRWLQNKCISSGKIDVNKYVVN
ncbi:MAG: DUF4957 domain-containing protein, partial [Sediminibacterium sp.]|nr:DUF4957 domain-containing protein [Sediminibacterium sp.]